MSARSLVFAAAVLVAHSGRVAAQESEFRFPTGPIAPQTVALGGAGVAEFGDAEAVLNPASLLGSRRLGVHRFDGFAGYNGFGAAGHLRFGSRLAIGLTFRHFDYGTLVEDDLAPGVDDLDAREESFALGAAVRVARAVWLGAAVSHLSADYFGSVTSANVVSLGAIASYSRQGRLGVSLRSLGGDATNSDDPGARYPVPSRLRVGAVQGLSYRAHEFRILVDGEIALRGQARTSLHVGTEWRPMQALALRAGLESGENADVAGQRDTRYSAGVGLKIGPADLALGARFGGIEGANELFIGVDAF
jgi:hypothetical protein